MLIKKLKIGTIVEKNTWYLPTEDFHIFIELLANIPEIEINSSDKSQYGYHPQCKKHRQRQHYNIDEIPINN